MPVVMSTPSCILSPSSRRAWVEIICGLCQSKVLSVALLAEGVGRNICAVIV